MKRMLTSVAAALIAVWAYPAAAQEDTTIRIEEPDETRAEIGVAAGWPTGFTGKLWLGEASAIQGMAAWHPATNGLVGAADYVMHVEPLNTQPDVRLPFYAGVGARFIEHNDRGDTDEWAFGPRVPLGVAAILPEFEMPLSFYAEVAPALEVGRGEAAVTADAQLGARLIF